MYNILTELMFLKRLPSITKQNANKPLADTRLVLQKCPGASLEKDSDQQILIHSVNSSTWGLSVTLKNLEASGGWEYLHLFLLKLVRELVRKGDHQQGQWTPMGGVR